MDGSGLPEKGLGCSPALLKEFAQRRYDMSGLSGMYRTWFPHGTEQRAAHGFVYLIPPVQSNKLSKASPPRANKQAKQSKQPPAAQNESTLHETDMLSLPSNLPQSFPFAPHLHISCPPTALHVPLHLLNCLPHRPRL